MILRKQLKYFRSGGIGALLDEYERAVSELKTIICSAGEEDYLRIADSETENPECRSIQTMLSHVIDAGYAYSNNIRKVISMDGKSYEFKHIGYQDFEYGIDKMFEYQVETLDGKFDISYEEIDSIVYRSPHGYTETLEQILEHAIVHILRHRRQTEKILTQV